MPTKKWEFVGSLPAPTQSEFKSLKSKLSRQTAKIWKAYAELGEGSPLLRNAQSLFNEINQYQTSSDPEAQEEFRKLLFGSWYNLWRSNDFSIEAMDARRAAGMQRLPRTQINILWDHTVREGSATFHHLFAPLFDPESLEYRYLDQGSGMSRARSHLHAGHFSAGFMIGDDISKHFWEWFKRTNENSEVECSYLARGPATDVGAFRKSWIEPGSEPFVNSMLNECVIWGASRVTGEFHFSEMHESRFEGNLDASGGTLQVSEPSMSFNSRVNGSVTIGQCSGSETEVSVGRFVKQVRISSNASELFTLTESNCDVEVFENRNKRMLTQMMLTRVAGDALISTCGGLEIRTKQCTFRKANLRGFSSIECVQSVFGHDAQADSFTLESTGVYSVSLHECDFKSRIYIHISQPMNDLYITNCSFGGLFVATDLSVSGDLVIYGSEFFGTFNIKSSGANAISTADFGSTAFRSTADFSNVKFEGRCSFDLSSFDENAIFHGSELHQDTSFRGTKFNWQNSVGRLELSKVSRAEKLRHYKRARRALWPNLRSYRKGKLLRAEKLRMRLSCRVYEDYSTFQEWFTRLVRLNQFASSQVVKDRNELLGEIERAFRTLRQAMEKNNASDQAAIFHQNEMRARHSRLGDGSVPRSEKWIGKVYDFTAEYGASFVRPLILLAGLWLFCAGAYWLGAPKTSNGSSLVAALVVSAVVMLRPLYQLNPNYKAGPDDTSNGVIQTSNDLISWYITHHEGWFKLGSTIQSLLAVVLVFLVLLAIRRRFQLS